MIRRLGRWLTPLVVLALWAAAARADGDSGSERVPVLAYFLAFAFTVLALVVVCMPSRKS
jgi:hypothetical protein